MHFAPLHDLVLSQTTSFAERWACGCGRMADHGRLRAGQAPATAKHAA
jgi:hypothetical protein